MPHEVEMCQTVARSISTTTWTIPRVRDVQDIIDADLEGVEIGKRLHLLANPDDHLELLHLDPKIFKHRKPVPYVVCPHDEHERFAAEVPESPAVGVLVVAAEIFHDSLEVNRKI